MQPRLLSFTRLDQIYSCTLGALAVELFFSRFLPSRMRGLLIVADKENVNAAQLLI